MKCTKDRLDFSQRQNIQDEGTRTIGLRLDFRGAPLRSVLGYFQDAAGLPIEVARAVEIERSIELWHDEPVSKEEAIRLLKQALDGQGYAAVNKSGMLAIIPRQEAKKHYIPLPKLECGAFAG